MTDDIKALLQRLRHYGDNDRDAACAFIERQAVELEEWSSTLWAVARELNCLPSTYSDGNGHVLKAAIKLNAERDQLRKHLEFVERWAVHHGSHPRITPHEVLSTIQHYPPIKAITKGYTDGRVPETRDPWAEADQLRAQLEALRADAAQWQPIETAPRGSGENGPDSTTHPDYIEPPTLLLWTQEGPRVGYYDWYYHPGYGRGADPHESPWRCAEGGQAYGPTHWMPLPAAPAA